MFIAEPYLPSDKEELSYFEFELKFKNAWINFYTGPDSDFRIELPGNNFINFIWLWVKMGAYITLHYIRIYSTKFLST